MIKINGTPQVEVANIEGYARVSGALVNADCDYFFERRGMSRSEHGRFGFLPFHPNSGYNNEGPNPKVVRIKRSDLSRNRK